MTADGVLALFALALGRTTVSFQFQSVTPLADQLSFEVTQTALGVLLGLYMAPGVMAAVSAPFLLRRLGSAGALYLAFALMAVGQCGVVLAESLNVAYAARLVAGVGGCVVYVITVGFVAQLADAGPLSRRMGVIASSWPVGNALALVVLGALLARTAIKGWVPLLMVALATALIAFRFHVGRHEGPLLPRATIEPATVRAWMHELGRGFGVASSFALYNVAFILLTSFSPRFLVGEGFNASAATSIASLPMWLFIGSVPFGGVLAGWIGKKDGVLVAAGCLGSALAILLALVTPNKAVWYVIAGLLGGLPTAPMWASAGGGKSNGRVHHLTYPALFLVFFTALLICPPVVGGIVDVTQDARFALVACIALLVLAALVFFAARRSSDTH